MKKFLLAALTVFGVIFGQMILAEAYSEGDKMIIYVYRCYHCHRKGLSVSLNGKEVRYDLRVNDCPYWSHLDEGQRPHHWMEIESHYYTFSNGQWVEN